MHKLWRAVVFKLAEIGLFVLLVLAVLVMLGPLVYGEIGGERARAFGLWWQWLWQMVWAGVACMALPLFGLLFVAARLRDLAAERRRRIFYDVARLVKREAAWEWRFEQTVSENFPHDGYGTVSTGSTDGEE